MCFSDKSSVSLSSMSHASTEATGFPLTGDLFCIVVFPCIRRATKFSTFCRRATSATSILFPFIVTRKLQSKCKSSRTKQNSVIEHMANAIQSRPPAASENLLTRVVLEVLIVHFVSCRQQPCAKSRFVLSPMLLEHDEHRRSACSLTSIPFSCPANPTGRRFTRRPSANTVEFTTASSLHPNLTAISHILSMGPSGTVWSRLLQTAVQPPWPNG